MNDPTPAVVSLVTGAGGLDLGLERAGFQTVAAIECDDSCLETLNAGKAAKIDIPTFAGRHYLAESVMVGESWKRDGVGCFERCVIGSRFSPALFGESAGRKVSLGAGDR